jgi:hypothetical protein
LAGRHFDVSGIVHRVFCKFPPFLPARLTFHYVQSRSTDHLTPAAAIAIPHGEEADMAPNCCDSYVRVYRGLIYFYKNISSFIIYFLQRTVNCNAMRFRCAAKYLLFLTPRCTSCCVCFQCVLLVYDFNVHPNCTPNMHGLLQLV